MDERGEFIPPGALHECLRQPDAPDAPTVIDVRDVEEYATGHIPGARHVPVDQLQNRLGEVPRGRPVVTY